MAGRTIVDLGAQGGFADDDGAADAALRTALAHARDVDGPQEVSAALVGARLLIPIVAAPSTHDGRNRGEHGADLALVTVIGRDGRRALPAFTDLDALARWRTEARPVPVRAEQAAAATYDEGAEALVLDIAGPTPHVVQGTRLAALAGGHQWRPAHADRQVLTAVQGHLLEVAGSSVTAFVRPSEQADALVLLVPAPNLAPVEVQRIARALAERVAADIDLRSRLDTGLDVAVASSAEELVQGGVDESG